MVAMTPKGAAAFGLTSPLISLEKLVQGTAEEVFVSSAAAWVAESIKERYRKRFDRKPTDILEAVHELWRGRPIDEPWRFGLVCLLIEMAVPMALAWATACSGRLVRAAAYTGDLTGAERTAWSAMVAEGRRLFGSRSAGQSDFAALRAALNSKLF